MSCHLLSATTYPNTVVDHCPLWCPFPEHRFRCCEILLPPLRWFLNFIFLGSCRWQLRSPVHCPLPPLDHARLPPSKFPVCERETATRDSHGRLMWTCPNAIGTCTKTTKVLQLHGTYRVPCMLGKICVVTVRELAVGGKLAAHPQLCRLSLVGC